MLTDCFLRRNDVQRLRHCEKIAWIFVHGIFEAICVLNMKRFNFLKHSR